MCHQAAKNLADACGIPLWNFWPNENLVDPLRIGHITRSLTQVVPIICVKHVFGDFCFIKHLKKEIPWVTEEVLTLAPKILWFATRICQKFTRQFFSFGFLLGQATEVFYQVWFDRVSWLKIYCSSSKEMHKKKLQFIQI